MQDVTELFIRSSPLPTEPEYVNLLRSPESIPSLAESISAPEFFNSSEAKEPIRKNQFRQSMQPIGPVR